MCDINVFVLKNGREERIMENVERVERVDETGLKIQNIFGESRVLRGRMFLYDNSSKKMVFEPV